ncbi:hypothetical protein MBANPS3_005002 [Mucor bainieri]
MSSHNEPNSLCCPHCQESTKQVLDDGGVVFCEHCEYSYLEEEGEQKYQSDAAEDEFTLLPPRDNASELSQDSDDSVDIESERRNVFDDDPQESDSHANSTPTAKSEAKGKQKAKPKEKRPSKPPKRSAPQQKIKSAATTEASTKLPSIFKDALIPTHIPSAKPKKYDAFDDDELAFSDFSDDEEMEFTPIKRQTRMAQKRRRDRQLASFTDSDTDDDEEEEEPISVFKLSNNNNSSRSGSRASETSITSYPKSALRTTMPLKQYSPFAQFNKEMRAKLAKEHKEAIEASDNPRKYISQLVADAWKTMPKTEKDAFKERMIVEKKHIASVARKKTARPSGNGYILYSKVKLPQVKADNPQVTKVRELSAIVSKHWKALSDDQKEVYKAKAKKEREDWIKEHPEEHQQYMDRMTSKIRATKKARRDEKDDDGASLD